MEVEGYGEVEVDVAYGGMFYAVVQTQAFGIKCFNGNIEKLIQIGNKVQGKLHHIIFYHSYCVKVIAIILNVYL